MPTVQPKYYENIKQGIIIATYVFALGLMVRIADTFIDIKVILTNQHNQINSHTEQIISIMVDIKDGEKKDDEQDHEIKKLTNTVGIIQDRTRKKNKGEDE